MKKIIALFGITALLSGCFGPEKGTSEYEQQVQVEKVEEALGNAPEWFLSVPNSDNAVYGTGTGSSMNLQLSIDKALLNAKVNLADKLKGKVSSRLKQFLKEVGADGNKVLISTIEKSTLGIIQNADLSGYQQQDLVTFEENGKFRSYVLVKVSFDRVNRLALEAIKTESILETNLTSSESFKKMEEEIIE